MVNLMKRTEAAIEADRKLQQALDEFAIVTGMGRHDLCSHVERIACRAHDRRQEHDRHDHLLHKELIDMAAEGMSRDTLVVDALRRRGWLGDDGRTIIAPPDIMAEAERRVRAKLDAAA
jgi:hypothetical protein